MLCSSRGDADEPQPEHAATPSVVEGVLAAVRTAVDGSWPRTTLEADMTALRARVNLLGSAEAYTGHVAMGTLLASRCAACRPSFLFSVTSWSGN